MKVKIIKCSNGFSWYEKIVGGTVEAEDHDDDFYWYKTKNGKLGILKVDCEIVEEEKRQFQIGDEVIYCNTNWFIENIYIYYCDLINKSGCRKYDVKIKDLKPIKKEKQMFDLKKNGWYIETPTPEISKAVQEWLFEQGIYWNVSGKRVSYTNAKFITNASLSDYKARGYIMHSSDVADKDAKEIKLTFKTVVENVEYPEVKSEAQVEFEKLQEQIKQLQEQADILKSKL